MLENIKWKLVSVVPIQKTEVTIPILPLPQITMRDLYLWGKKNKVIKRLPRKIKKQLYYCTNNKFARKACNIFTKIVNNWME
jgi:hypothetical protein